MLTNAICGSSYSRVGTNLAQTSHSGAHSVSSWTDARKILRKGFDAIVESPVTTDFEKTLAGYGINVGTDCMEDKDAVKARYIVMEKIIYQQSCLSQT